MSKKINDKTGKTNNKLNIKRSSSFKILDERTRSQLKASVEIYQKRFRELISVPDMEKIKGNASKIREEDLKRAPELWDSAISRLKGNGVDIHYANNNKEAIRILNGLLRDKNHIVKSKSNLLNEIGLQNISGKKIVETDIGDWLVQEMGTVRIHPNAPAMGLTLKEISVFLRKKYKLKIKETAEVITKEISKIIRNEIFCAEVGLTGANFVTSEGHIVIVENEGNISLVTRVPKIHIAVVAYHRIVETLEKAVYLSKCLSMFGTGKRSTAYINIISSPSYTTDIEKRVIHNAQGAEEVHLVIVDNNRSNLLKNDKLRQALNCIGCGACMLHCPVSKVAGPNFGGSYQGGIGIVFSHSICKENVNIANGLFACLNCEMCEEICPVGAKIGSNIRNIRGVTKSKIGQNVLKKILKNRQYSYNK
ncbi:MAG: LUD domain-containing protein [bacterium]